jgi:uncharacterized protein
MDRLDVFRLARTGDEVSGSIRLASLPRLCAGLQGCNGELTWHASGRIDALGRPALRLRLQAVLPVRCDHCGGPLQFELAADRDFYFVDSEAELAAIPIDDAPEEALLGSTNFDLKGLIEDEAILQVPISPRHDSCQAPAGLAGLASDSPLAQTRQTPFTQLAELRDSLAAPKKASLEREKNEDKGKRRGKAKSGGTTKPH